jgi:hypothetical protein
VLSDEQIRKFQELYQKRFGKQISKEDALEGGLKLVRLVQLVYQPMSVEDYERLQERRLKCKV